MKKFTKLLSLFLALVVLLASFPIQTQAATSKKPYLSATKKTVYKGVGYTLELFGTEIKSTKSSNKKIATVDKNGKITAKKAGKATITITGENGKKYTCKVTVPECPYPLNTLIDEGTLMYWYHMDGKGVDSTSMKNKIYATFCKRAGMCYKGCKHENIRSNVAFGNRKIAYWNGKRIFTYDYTLLSPDISHEWVMEGSNCYIDLKKIKIKSAKSSNPAIATVTKEGIVTGKSVGKATITLKGKNGKTYKWYIYVREPYISTPIETLYKGTYFTLSVFGTNIVSSKSSNSKVATVNKKGKVTAKKKGTATITLKGENGRSYKCIVKVDVRPKSKYPLYKLEDKGKKISWYFINGDPYASDFNSETIEMFCKRHGVTQNDVLRDMKFMRYQIKGQEVEKITISLR